MIYVFLADGFEEIEALAPVDILRRAGLTVQTVGVGAKTVTGAHGISVEADRTDAQICLDDALQAVLLPGGQPGTMHLEAAETVQRALDFAAQRGLLIAAICAAPSILGHKGLLNGKQAICFPSFEDALKGATLSDKPVCRDGNFITAKGMGVAVEFGLAVAAALTNEETAQKIRTSIQCA